MIKLTFGPLYSTLCWKQIPSFPQIKDSIHQRFTIPIDKQTLVYKDIPMDEESFTYQTELEYQPMLTITFGEPVIEEVILDDNVLKAGGNFYWHSLLVTLLAWLLAAQKNKS